MRPPAPVSGPRRRPLPTVMPLYDRPVRVLMHEMVDDLGIRPGHEFTRDQAISWFREQYPLVKEGTVAAHLTRLSVNNKNRLHYNARSDGSDDLLVQTDSTHFRLYEAGKDPAPIRANPRWTVENRPFVDTSKPATSGAVRDWVRVLHG